MSRKKQLQRLKPAEDERKLQTKRFVEQCEWKSKDREAAPVEQLWERSREERKETNSEAKYRNLEGKHEKSGWRERGN